MSNQLLSIKCSICDYIALVTYNRHFEYSCQQELDTVGCSRCNQLSIVPVTKEASYPHPTREEFRLIYDADKEIYFRNFELCYQMYDTPMVCEPFEKIHCGWCNSQLSVGCLGLFGIASRYVAAKSKALALHIKNIIWKARAFFRQ